jgi:hypothetical protein
MVSRRHLSVRSGPEGLWITDLDSLNGTYLDGEYLEPRSERFAPLGARLQQAPPDGPNLLVWQRPKEWGGDIDALERTQHELVQLRTAYAALQEENQRLLASEPTAGASAGIDWEQCAHLVTEVQDELNSLRLTLLDQAVPSSIHGLLSRVSTRVGDLKGQLLRTRRM